MILSKEQFPVVVQAYEITNNQEFFMAEQVVNNQSEVDVFVTRYAGKLIKARAITSSESSVSTKGITGKKTSAGLIFLVVLIVLVVLAAIAYFTGWLRLS